MSVWLALAALSGFLSVAIGAFGAHGLEGRVGPQAMEWLQTGLRYQMLHVAGLLAVAILALRSPAGHRPQRSLTVAGVGFAMGTLIFCGLLYAMALGAPRWFGAIVPIGGLAFLVGWAALAWYAGRAARGRAMREGETR